MSFFTEGKKRISLIGIANFWSMPSDSDYRQPYSRKHMQLRYFQMSKISAKICIY